MDEGTGNESARNGVLARIRGIGPELIAGGSDNDPTNVGTAAVAGAQTGYRLAWVALLTGPLLYVVMVIAAQLGVAARGDLQSLTLRRYGRRVAGLLLVSVVLVNMVTIAADLQAGAAGIGLLTGADSRWLVLPLGAAVAGLLLAGRYGQVVAVLRFLLPGFLIFAAAAVLAHPDWPRLLQSSFVPILPLRRNDLTGAVALTGTTLTSYVYVWETIQRGVEDPDRQPSGGQLRKARMGAATACIFTAAILWSMLVASAATLGRAHQSASSAQDAARALRPLAGVLAGDLFAVGLIVSAVVALPVLIASTAYVVGAHFDWRRGLSQPVRGAGRFYAVLIAPIVLASAAAFAGLPVLATLVAASVIGGLATPIGLVILLRLARDSRVMNGQPISALLAAAGWLVTLLIGGLALLFLLLPGLV